MQKREQKKKGNYLRKAVQVVLVIIWILGELAPYLIALSGVMTK